MINKIRDDILSKRGKVLKFRHNGARNQIEEFKGVIIGVYNYIFTIKTIDEKEEIKSFSYSDILINNLEIYNLKEA